MLWITGDTQYKFARDLVLLPSLQPWVQFLNFLCLSFHISEGSIIIELASWVVLKIKLVNMCKALKTCVFWYYYTCKEYIYTLGELNMSLFLQVLIFSPNTLVYFQSICMVFDSDFQKYYRDWQVKEHTNFLRPCE